MISLFKSNFFLGEIHIAHFRVQQPEHFDDLNMFIFGAVADINEGKTQLDSNEQPLLPGIFRKYDLEYT